LQHKLSTVLVIGKYNKETIQRVVEETRRNATHDSAFLKVYLTADRDVNAHAIRLGFVPTLNAIYLNRSMLHILETSELSGIIGHELGHATRYYNSTIYSLPIQIIFNATIYMLIIQYVKWDSGFEWMIIMAVGFALTFLEGVGKSINSHKLEFLCDDYGASIVGVIPMISSLYKIGRRAEAETKTLAHVFELKKLGLDVNSKKLIELYKSSLPYDDVSAEDMIGNVSRQLKNHTKGNQGISLRGFINYIQNDDGNQQENLAKTQHELNKIINRPKLASRFNLTAESSEEEVAQFIDEISAHPELALFHLESEVGGNESHPSFRSRLLYLWKNKDAIKS
jgi:hypothetical protein